MEKTKLKNRLKIAKNNYILAFTSFRLFQENSVIDLLSKLGKYNLGRYTIYFNQISNSLSTKEKMGNKCDEFIKMAIRMILKEPFELVKSYCNNTNQFALFKNQDWYDFARLLRNSISHDMKFQFKNNDKKKLPVSYRGKILDISMDEEYVDLKFFDWNDAYDLFCDICKFAESLN